MLVMAGRHDVADAAGRFDAEHIREQHLPAGELALIRQREERRGHRRTWVDHRRQVRVVEVERVRRGAEDHRAIVERLRRLPGRGLAQSGEDAARDVEQRALRFAADRRGQVFPARARQEMRERLRYSALMAACLTTGAHFAISSRMN